MAARLLVVDDDEAIRMMIRLYAERADFEVVGEAGACDDAVAIQKKVKADIVTMDYRMPGANGGECIKRLRDETPGVPILAVTSAGDDATTEMLAAGAYGTLDKAYVSVVGAALREGLILARSVPEAPMLTTGMTQLRDALARLEEEAAKELAARKRNIERRIELVAALDAIRVALDNPKYSQDEVVDRVRRLTVSALAADQNDGAE